MTNCNTSSLRLLTLILITLALSPALALINGQKASYNRLGAYPALGWNTWAVFKCNVSESLLLEQADLMLKYGLKDAGYNYLLLDDCWSYGRDPNTNKLVVDGTKFPSGMNHVTDWLHKRNMLFGIYSSAGKWTCAGYEASLDYEDIDALTFAEWGVDYLKYDNCFNEGRSGTSEISFKRYKQMSDALIKSGRDILYSMCNWGEDLSWDWAPTIANSWRMAGDVYDSYSKPDDRCPCGHDDYVCYRAGSHCSFMNVINKAAPIANQVRDSLNGFNDLDMLEVGNGFSTDDEYLTHFSVWSVLKSPLIMTSDMRTLSPEAFSIMSNPAILALNQDPLAVSAIRLYREQVADKDKYGFGEVQAWAGELYGGDIVVVMLNGGTQDREMSIDIETIAGLYSSEMSNELLEATWLIYDSWGNRMSREQAQQLLEGRLSLLSAYEQGLLYNSTELSYQDGLKQGKEVLLGKKIGELRPGESITRHVPSHGVVVLRLRNKAKESHASAKDRATEQQKPLGEKQEL